MEKGNLRQSIQDWMAAFVALFGLFLIYKDVTLIGVLLYGIVMHMLLLVYFNTLYNDVALTKFIDEVKAKRRHKTWLRRQIGRLQIAGCFALSLYVLAIKGRWYLFAVTCTVIILGLFMVKIILKELRGSKMVLGG